MGYLPYIYTHCILHCLKPRVLCPFYLHKNRMEIEVDTKPVSWDDVHTFYTDIKHLSSLEIFYVDLV